MKLIRPMLLLVMVLLCLGVVAAQQTSHKDAKKASTKSETSMGMPMPKPSPQIEKLAGKIVGTWNTNEDFEVSEMMPKGGKGHGTAIIKKGPGGLSVVEDYHSRGGTQFRKSNHWWKAAIQGSVREDGNLSLDLVTGKWLVFTPGFMQKAYREVGHYHYEEYQGGLGWKTDEHAIDQPSDKIPGIFVRGILNGAQKPGVLTGTQVVNDLVGRPGRGALRTYRVVMWPNYRDVECIVEIDKYEQWLPAAVTPRLPTIRTRT